MTDPIPQLQTVHRLQTDGLLGHVEDVGGDWRDPFEFGIHIRAILCSNCGMRTPADLRLCWKCGEP